MCVFFLPFWFWGRDEGFDCISSWSLPFFLLYSLTVPRHCFPAGTCRRNDVILTSMRHHHVASTSVRRHFDVMCPLGCIAVYYFSLFVGSALVFNFHTLYRIAHNLADNCWERGFLHFRHCLFYFSGAGKFCLAHGLRQVTLDAKSKVSYLQTFLMCLNK